MFKIALLVMFLLVQAVSFAQYLEYEEMMEVLDVAADTSATTKYMLAKKFIVNSIDEGEAGLGMVFESPVKDDDYFIGVYEDKTNGFYTIIEYTRNPARWDAYIRTAKRNDFAFSAMKNIEEGVTYFTYTKGEMLMGLMVIRSETGVKYQFSFTR